MAVKVGEPIYPDADPIDADWTKRTWDLNVHNVQDLRRLLKAWGMSVRKFKKLPIYKLNVDKIKWLKDL